MLWAELRWIQCFTKNKPHYRRSRLFSQYLIRWDATPYCENTVLINIRWYFLWLLHYLLLLRQLIQDVIPSSYGMALEVAIKVLRLDSLTALPEVTEAHKAPFSHPQWLILSSTSPNLLSTFDSIKQRLEVFALSDE